MSNDDEPLSGVATLEESSDEAFAANDEVVITMHVNLPGVEPVLTRLKSVVVETAGSGQTHSLFDSYFVTAKGVANNLEHFSSDDAKDSTTFRLTELALGVPAADPVFLSSAATDAYTIYSTATVEYQTANGRRLGEVATFRAGPVRRGLRNTAEVDVVATNVINVAPVDDAPTGDSSSAATEPSPESTASDSNTSSTTVIIIAVGAFVGAAFVVAGGLFLVRSRCMQSKTQKAKKMFYTRKPAPTQGAVATANPMNKPVVAKSVTELAPAAAATEAEADAPRKTRTKRIVRKKLRRAATSAGSGSVVSDVSGASYATASSAGSAASGASASSGASGASRSSSKSRKTRRVVRKKRVPRVNTA